MAREPSRSTVENRAALALIACVLGACWTAPVKPVYVRMAFEFEQDTCKPRGAPAPELFHALLGYVLAHLAASPRPGLVIGVDGLDPPSLDDGSHEVIYIGPRAIHGFVAIADGDFVGGVRRWGAATALYCARVEHPMPDQTVILLWPIGYAME